MGYALIYKISPTPSFSKRGDYLGEILSVTHRYSGGFGAEKK